MEDFLSGQNSPNVQLVVATEVKRGLDHVQILHQLITVKNALVTLWNLKIAKSRNAQVCVKNNSHSQSAYDVRTTLYGR